MAKKKSTKRLSRATRASILTTAKAKGWTAEEVAKKYGVSKWKKRGSCGTKHGTRAANTGRKASGSSVASGLTPATLQTEIRAILPALLREEISRTLMSFVGRGTTKRRRRGGKK